MTDTSKPFSRTAPVKKMWPTKYGSGEVTEQEYKIFLNIQTLLQDNFTGSLCLHISEGVLRKTETTSVERNN